MQKRIKRFNNSGRRPFTTVVESDQSTNGKKRKERERDLVIVIFTTLTGITNGGNELKNINQAD